MQLRRVLPAVALAFFARPAAAQTPAPATPPYRPLLVAVDPLGIPFGYIEAEVQYRVATGVMIGVRGTSTDLGASDEGVSSSVAAQVKYYPGEVDPKGFALGLELGTASIHDLACGSLSCSTTATSHSSAIFGVTVDYNWLLGPRKRFLVGLGLGIDRVLDPVQDGMTAVPVGRFVTGWTF